MSKIHIIIQREYTSRVMKKSFLILTFITPIFMAAMMFIPYWITTLKDDTVKNIVVVDKSNLLRNVLKSNTQYNFMFSDNTIDELRSEQQSNTKNNNKELTAVLFVGEDLLTNPNAAAVYSEKQINIELKDYLSVKLNNFIRDQRIAALNIPDLKEKIEKTSSDVKIATIKWDSSGKEQEASAELALIIGMASAFLIYIFIMSYGSQVMQGVMQEKTSRIVEVIISSVKPFELMMGKIIGIALVGLTQFSIWIIFTLILSGVGSMFIGADSVQAVSGAMEVGQASMPMNGESGEMIARVMTMLSGFDFVKVLLLFIFYFLGGYLLYASMYAAIGSAVDNETDSQQFMFPITIPIMVAIFIGIYAAQSPDSALAFWGSIIPFTSPVVMMGRLPYDVPAWQLALSMAILVGSFILSTWLAGKIYRTGILMYGKKVSWAELWKWIRVK